MAVTFTQVGSDLHIYLVNTTTAASTHQTDVLTGVYFDIAGTQGNSLTRGNATLHAGSIVLRPPSAHPTGTFNGSGVVGGEVAFVRDSGGLSGGVNQKFGVSSSGMGIFGPSDLLNVDDPTNAINLYGPMSPDGLQYGQVGTGGITTGGSLTTGAADQPLIQNGIDIVLHGFGGTLDASTISNIRFQFGTALSDPHFGPNAVPVPPTAVMLVTGLAAVGLSHLGLRLRRKTNVPA